MEWKDDEVNSRERQKAIWYNLKLNEWSIGDLDFIGENSSKISTYGSQGNHDLFEIPDDKWIVLQNYNNWKKSVPGDITINCRKVIYSHELSLMHSY